MKNGWYVEGVPFGTEALPGYFSMQRLTPRKMSPIFNSLETANEYADLLRKHSRHPELVNVRTKV